MPFEPTDINALVQLSDQLLEQGRTVAAQMIRHAVAEMEALRVSQFRWINVSERMPTREEVPIGKCVMVSYGDNHGKFRYGTWWMWDKIFFEPEIVAWALFPPMPEKTQQEKDEQQWQDWVSMSGNYPQDGHRAFLAGLKAAREQK